MRDAVREAMAANAPLETTVEITAVTEDHPVLLGGLDAGLAAVREVLANPSYRENAERMRDEMELLTGPEYAVELLERLAVEKQPLPTE